MKILGIVGLMLLMLTFISAQGGQDNPRGEAESPSVKQAPSLPPPELPPGVSDYRKPTDRELRDSLSDMEYQVTQHEGTEPPFQNPLWDNKEPGIYVDIVSGEPLFSSTDKYNSGTGWPSFIRPLEAGNIVERRDNTLGMVRIEVRSFFADSHLGHVFTDGPQPTGLRYCINSASLRFVPLEEMALEGYGDYLVLFE